MKKNGFFKKAQAWVLALAIFMSVLVPFSGFCVLAETKKTQDAYEGKIVANNYNLSNAEKQLIASGLLTGKTHSYLAPDAQDELITVDTDNKTVTVKKYEGTSGYVWKAVSVNIVVGSEVKETVLLTDGKGSYTYDGNAFSVIAKYALDITVAEKTQKDLLNAPKYLTEGLGNLKDIADVKSDLAIIEQAMPQMMQLATTGMLVNIQDQYITISFNTEAAKTATKALNDQMTANNGKLDLTVMLEEYESSASKVKYLVENGALLKAKAEETQKYIDDILTASFWSLIDVLDQSEYSVLFVLRSSVRNTSTDLGAACTKAWDILDNAIVKDGLTDFEYGVIDTMIAQITSLTDVSAIEIKNPLRAATTDVQFNMSMFDVTVKVALNLTDATSTDIKYNEYDSKKITVTLAENATEAEIIAAVLETGIEANAKASWGTAYVDGKFTAQKSALPQTLTKDIEYVITYVPNMYDVTFTYGSAGTASYPYGYVVNFEKHVDLTKAYDYTVNGAYYAQGSSYTVEGETTIERKEGKSYVASDLYQIVSDNYLTGKAAAILTSGALLNNKNVAVRYPDNTNNIVTLVGNELTALDYEASYNGLSWKPYSYTLSNKNTHLFNGQNTVVITEAFDSVTVNYRLYLENFDNGTVIDVTNIANQLNVEAKDQIAALDRISAQKDNLEILNRTMVNILAGLIENTSLNDDAEKSAKLQESFGNVLNDMQAQSMGATNLYLYDIVSAYKDSSDGLLYYYNNYQTVIEEIDKMAVFMTRLLGEDNEFSAQDKIDALERLIRSLPSNIVSPDKIDEYVSKLTNLESTMNGVKNDLTAPNAIIDLESDALATLTNALQASGNTQNFTTLDEALHLKDSTIVMVASDKKAVTVTLLIEGGKNVTVTSEAVFVDSVFDQNFVNNLKNAINNELASQSINGKYYDNTYNANAFDELVGKIAGEATTTSFEFAWTYKNFEVSVPGADTQYVSLKARRINLPASTDAAYRYDYYINGVKVTGNTYTLSDADLDNVIAGTFSVTKKEVYILRENLTNYVNGLNQSIGNDQAIFALVEDNAGNFSIVLKADASAPNGLTTAVQGMAMGMVQGSYPYVGIDDNAFLDGGKVYLQTVIDALLESGFGVDTMLEVVDRNGNIKNMDALGTVITDKAFTQYGGKLMKTTMQLGTEASDAVSVPFYVTLGAVNEDFVNVRNLFEDELGSFVTFGFENGAIDVSFNMPDKMYEAFLAVLLVTENININDINAVNGEITVSFLNNLLIPLFKGEITVETFENTLAMFGVDDINLSSQKGAQSLFDTIKSFYVDSEYSYDETSGIATGTIAISSFIDSMNIGVLGNMIAEKDTGIDIRVRLGLQDLGKEYEALYVDTDAAGKTNMIGLTEDLSKKLDEIKGTSVIVLLKDVQEDLTFKTATLFNLNGFNVNGNINANAKTIVIDSSIDSSKTATVTGSVSGNATLVAGKYIADVSAFVKNGFIQNADGTVTNKFYSLYKDAQGDVIVELKAGLIHTSEMPDITSLALDIACDLLFNGYSSNYLEIDGNTIYNLTIKDLVGIYASSNRVDTVINEAMGFIDSTQLSAFANTLLDDAMDLTSISKAIANDEPVFEYSLTTKPWDVELVHVKPEDYITSNVISGEKANATNIKIFVTGEQADKDYFADLFEEFGNTIDADINVNISHSKDGKTIKIDAAADANIMVDWTNPDYAIMFSVIAADGITGASRDNIVSAIRTYYNNGDLSELSLAFNSLTTSQLVTAVKNVAKNDNFADMVTSLGLEDVVSADVAELEALYDKMGKVIAAVVRKTDITGGNRTLGSFLDSDETYGITRTNVEKLFEKNLLRGYGLDVNVSISSASFKIKLFENNVTEVDLTELNRQIAIAEAINKDKYTDETWKAVEETLADAIEARKATIQAVVDKAANALAKAIEALELKAPEFVDGHGNAEVVKDDKIVGSYVDHANKTIFIDTQISGITVAEIKTVLKFYANNADAIELTIGEGLTDTDLVKNGTKVTAKATNESTKAADVTYTVIILGDTNCNGRIDVGDAVLISRDLVGELVGDEALSQAQIMAADTNWNGRTDIGDATRIASKIVDEDKYESMLGKAVI